MGSKDRLTVVVDTDVIIAQAYTKDLHHEKTLKLHHRLLNLNAYALYPATSVAEAITVLQRKISDKTLAYKVALSFTHPNAEILEINQKVLSLAVKKYYNHLTSKKNTLFDCIVAASTDIYKADAIFSFDKFYKKQGFKLASDL